jgi:glycerol-3-phosphate dehydrogenase
MARDAVDAVLGDGARRRPSATAEIPIIGAAPRPDLEALAARMGTENGIAADVAASLVDRHGTKAPHVLELGREHDLVRSLAPDLPFLEAEVAWAAENELAISLDDLLVRRFRLAPTLPDRGASIAPRVAAIAGHILGWDADRQAREVDAYLELARRDFAVPG